MTETTTLGRIAGSDATPALVATFAKEQARIADELEAGAHAEALRNFSDFMAGRPRADQRIYLLWKISFVGDSDVYSPGENQRLLFGKLGVDGTAPLPDATLNELAAAAVDDFLEHIIADTSKVRDERDQALSRAEGAEAADTAKAEAEAKVTELTTALEEISAERDTLREHVTHYASMLGGEETKPAPSRRTSVAGHVGVYLGRDRRNLRSAGRGYRGQAALGQSFP